MQETREAKKESKDEPLTKQEILKIKNFLNKLERKGFDSTVSALKGLSSGDRPPHVAANNNLANPLINILKDNDRDLFNLFVKFIKSHVVDQEKRQALLQEITKITISNTNSLEVIQDLEEELTPEQFQQCISADQLSSLYRKSIWQLQGDLKIFTYIASKLSSAQKDNRDYLNVLLRIATEAMRHVHADEAKAHLVIFLSELHPAIFASVVEDQDKPTYERNIRAYVNGQISLFTDLVRSCKDTPILDDRLKLDDNTAKKCIYMIRFLLRELCNENDRDKIDLLLKIPAVEALAAEEMPTFRGVSLDTDCSTSTLLSLASARNNQWAVTRLMNIPGFSAAYEKKYFGVLAGLRDKADSYFTELASKTMHELNARRGEDPKLALEVRVLAKFNELLDKQGAELKAQRPVSERSPADVVVLGKERSKVRRVLSDGSLFSRSGDTEASSKKLKNQPDVYQSLVKDAQAALEEKETQGSAPSSASRGPK